MTAKFFIYRNLQHGNAFSVRQRGRVIDRLEDFVAHDITFKIARSGQAKAFTEQCRNVHAFVCAKSYTPIKIDVLGLTQVSYNPFRASTFQVLGDSIHTADSVIFSDGKCYLLE